MFSDENGRLPNFIITSHQPLSHEPTSLQSDPPPLTCTHTHQHAHTPLWASDSGLNLFGDCVYLLGGWWGEVEFFAAKLLLSVFNTPCVCVYMCVRACAYMMWTRDAMHSWAVSKVTVCFSSDYDSLASFELEFHWCWCRRCDPSCCSCCHAWRSNASLSSDFFFINMYICIQYIYIWSLCFVFLRASVTELHSISGFRKTGTARWSWLGRSGSSGFPIVIFPKHFRQTLLSEVLLSSGGYTEGHTAGLSMDCQWTLIVLSWG